MESSHSSKIRSDKTTARATFWAYTYASYNASSVSSESRTLTNSYLKCWNTPGLYADQICKRTEHQ